MAEVLPFPGVRFNPDRIDDLVDVIAPPYDVIYAPDRVELEKQLKVVEQDILTFRGAILACNELIEENEPKSEDTTGIVKEEDGG